MCMTIELRPSQELDDHRFVPKVLFCPRIFFFCKCVHEAVLCLRIFMRTELFFEIFSGRAPSRGRTRAGAKELNFETGKSKKKSADFFSLPLLE